MLDRLKKWWMRGGALRPTVSFRREARAKLDEYNLGYQHGRKHGDWSVDAVAFVNDVLGAELTPFQERFIRHKTQKPPSKRKAVKRKP